MKLKIAPSILSADFSRLGEEVREVESAGADLIHVDVMDGHFVPNLSMGPAVVKALRRVTRLPLDVHLMITEPGKYLDPFIQAGAHHISFHHEVVEDAAGLADGLRERGVGAGLVLNPETPVGGILDLLPHFDMILVMTVHPGFSGQGFLGDNLEKVIAIREAERALRAKGEMNRVLDVQVDGGIDTTTVRQALGAGANVFVAASSIFGKGDGSATPGEALRELRRALNSES